MKRRTIFQTFIVSSGSQLSHRRSLAPGDRARQSSDALLQNPEHVIRTSRMSRTHTEYYRHNQAYSEFLRRADANTFAKYELFLRQARVGGCILDVGSGAGQVVNRLAQFGYDAHGVEVSVSSLAVAKRGKGTFHEVAGNRLPFPNDRFDAVGSFTVLEHIEDPAQSLREMIRVTKPGGIIVVACPNFLRVVGLSSHHYRTRGIVNKFRNALTLLAKGALLLLRPHRLQFKKMMPVVADREFQPDDDAIIVTNPIDVRGIWKTHDIEPVYHSSLLYQTSPLLETISRLPVIRTVTGGVFLVGRKTSVNL